MYKSLIPNMLTSSNLVFGMCSIISTLHKDFNMGAIFILIALVADGLDGRAARFFGVSSELGKEMDSLCDLISFGAAPALLAYSIYLNEFGYFGWFAAIAFALCGAWRLARFNVNSSVIHGYFMGLAIPSGGCLIATFTLLSMSLQLDYHTIGFVYPIAVLVIAYLMVSKVRYPDFKGKGEKVYTISVVVAMLMLFGVLFVGRDSILCAVLFAVFSTYAVFGILNTIVSVFTTNVK